MTKHRFPPVIPARDTRCHRDLVSLPAAARILDIAPSALWARRRAFGGRRVQIGTSKNRLYFPAEELIRAAIPLRRDPISVGYRLADLLGVPREEMVDRVVKILWGDSAEAITARVGDQEARESYEQGGEHEIQRS